MRSSGSSAASRHTTQPTPSGARPNLWPDVLIDFTRGRRKSHSRSGAQNGARNAPLAPSTWMSMSSPVSACSSSSASASGLHHLVGTGVGDAERRHDHDRVLVDAGEHVVDVHRVVPGRHRDLAHLDVPVLGELVPHHLHRAADHVRLVGRLARPRSAWPASATWRPCRRACTPPTNRSPRRRPCSPTPARSTGRPACARSAARSRRSAGTRPCRSCSCRSPGPSAGGPPAPPTSGRTSPGSGASCRRASARRPPRRRHPPSATRRCGKRYLGAALVRSWLAYTAVIERRANGFAIMQWHWWTPHLGTGPQCRTANVRVTVDGVIVPIGRSVPA